MKLSIINKSELMAETQSKEQEETRKHKAEIIKEINDHKINKEEYEKIDKMLNYTYEYEKDVELPTKTSVTALKEINSIKAMLNAKNKINLSRDFDLIKSKITKSVSLNPQILNYFIKRIEITKLGETKIYYRF